MRYLRSRLRRNFVFALVGHVAVVLVLAIWQGKGIGWRDRAAVDVEIFTPADLLGDLPQGPGVGRGAYTPPRLGSGAAPESGSETVVARETPPPSPPARSATSAGFSEGDIPAPRVSPPRPAASTTGPVTSTRSVRPTNTVATTTTRTATAKVARAASSGATPRSAGPAGSPTGSPAGVSAADIRNRFARALQAEASGTPYGDGRRAGGGSGSSPVIGSRDGSPGGVAGGVGRGSPFWWYYQQVHDRLYEAWVHPPEAVNWDRRQFATVVIKVARNGEIVAVRLLTPSGNRSMDESALAAVESVGRLPPLPEGLGGATADITVNFQLEG